MKKFALLLVIVLLVGAIPASAQGPGGTHSPSEVMAICQQLYLETGVQYTVIRSPEGDLYDCVTGLPLTTMPAAPATSPSTTGYPPARCQEQMMGPFQPPVGGYNYVQINTEFVDSDYLVSLFWERQINLSGWLVQAGSRPITKVVFIVRTSIDEVQFNDPAGGVAWRLCAHPDEQLAAETQQHAENVASARSWLRVYNVGDLWISLQSGDSELKGLIRCIDPSIPGIPSCRS